MANQIVAIQNTVTSAESTNEIAIALGHDPQDEAARNKAAKYAYGVLATIKASIGTKQDLSGCDPESVKATMIEAANRGVYIDGRQHAHLVKYGTKCTFQMGFRGYLAKIKEYYPDADFVVEPVYKGDEVKIWNDNGQQKYMHKKAGAFRSGEKDFLGILFAVTYTDNGRVIQKVTDVPKDRIDRARGAAKQDFIWKSDYIEKAKAAAIKSACKQLFASIQGLQDIVDYDNRNYDPNQGAQPATPARKSIVDNINQSVQENQQAEEEVAPEAPEGDIEGDFTVVEEEPSAEDQAKAEELIKAGEAAAQQGWHKYKEWVAALSDEDKDLVRDKHAGWTETARQVTRAAQAKEAEAATQEPQQNESEGDSDAPPL